MLRLLSTSGKADRFEWWVVSLVSDVVAQLGVILGLVTLASEDRYRWVIASALFLVATLAFWSAIAVSFRRWRDRQRPLWWLFLALVPLIGWAWFLLECGFLPAPGSQVRKQLVRRTVTAPNASPETSPDGDSPTN